MSQYTGGRKAGPKVVAVRDRVATLATENAALKGHIRTLVLAGEAVLYWLPTQVPQGTADDLKAAIDAAKLAK